MVGAEGTKRKQDSHPSSAFTKQQKTKMATTAATNHGGDYPLKDIPQPHPHDVLCGRGGGTNNHIGNSHWRMLVAANKQLYITLPKRQKMLLSRSIVNAVRSQNPPGRFLQKDSKSNKWFDVGDQRAQEKTSQALREGAPDIRKKVAEEEKDGDVAPTTKSTESPGDDKSEASPTSPPSEIEAKPNGVSSNSQATPAAPPVAAHQPQHQPVIPHPYGAPNGGGMPPMHAYPMHPHAQSPYPPHMNMMAYPPQMGMPPHMQHAHHQGYAAHMVMNEQGMMVPAPYMQHHPQMMPHHMHSGMRPPQQAPAHSAAPHYDSEPIPYNPVAGDNPTNFDEYVLPPDSGLEPSALSFGSVMMSDTEMKKLESGGTSFGTAMSFKNTEKSVEPTAALESARGASFGDMSMMSVGTRKLEDAGYSFGSQMSYNTMRADIPDGGLDVIGASFGSLSLDTTNRHTLFQQLEIAAAGPEIPPMLNSTKSTSNLLACSDSESEEDESQKHVIARKKSQAWERMQASVANNISSQKSKSTAGSGELMPPPAAPADKTGTDISVPTTRFDRDFSQLSAFDDDFNNHNGDDDGLPPPPSQLAKLDDEDEKLELFLIQQHSKS